MVAIINYTQRDVSNGYDFLGIQIQDAGAFLY